MAGEGCSSSVSDQAMRFSEAGELFLTHRRGFDSVKLTGRVMFSFAF